MLAPRRFCSHRSTYSIGTIGCQSRRCLKNRQAAFSIRCQAGRPQDNRLAPILVGGAALLAATLMHATQPAWADLETVAPATVTSLAKPLPQQKVEKGKVWTIFVLGAAGLFGGTLLLENNEKLFPAISKANKAMTMARQSQQAKQKIEEAIDVEGNDERLQSAVVAGLNEARQRSASIPAASSSGESKAQQESPEQHADEGRDQHKQGAEQLGADEEESAPPSERQKREESELALKSGSRSSNG